MAVKRMVVACLIGAALSAVGWVRGQDSQQFTWSYNVTAYAGTDTRWVSPGSLPLEYGRYYSRNYYDGKVEIQVFGNWMSMTEMKNTAYEEMSGPIPAEGEDLIAEHISYSDPENGVTVEADIRAYVDGLGFFRFDVTNFTASVPMRIMLRGYAKFLATNTVFGDLDGNGVLNRLDANRYAKILAGSALLPPDMLLLADLDSDDEITLKDYCAALLFADGLIPTAYTGWNF